MRPPVVQLVVAYGAGLWAGLAFSMPRPVSVAVAAGGVAAGAAGSWGGLLAAAAGTGVLTGSLAGERRRAGCAAVWSAETHVATVRVHDRAGVRGLARVTVLSAPEQCGGDLLLRAEPGSLPAGARAVIVGLYRPPAVWRARHVRVLRGPRPWRWALRDAIGRRIERLYGPRAPLVEALILGRREDLDPGWRRIFAEAGIAHLLAISGLHVGILAAWTLALGRLLWPARIAMGLTACAVWGYVVLLGLPAPAVRAAGFITIRTVAQWRQRHPPPQAALAVAALVVLAVDPLAATEVGAWLSVAATWGTGWALQRLEPVERAVSGRAVLRLLAASGGATLATAPISAFAFGTVAPVGLLTNLVAVPLAGVVVPGAFGSLAAGWPLASGTGLALAALERAAVLARSVPGGQIRGAPGAAFAAPWLALLLVVVWWAGWVRRPRFPVRAAALAAAAAAWGLAAVSAVARRADQGGLTLYVLDVGQGDAIALRTPHGRWALVDGGPRTAAGDAGRTVVLPFLRRHGVGALDVVIATHGDADHLGGVPALVEALVPELVLEPGQPLGTPLYLEYLRAVDAAGVRWRPARAGDTLVLDSVTLAILHPSESWVETHLAPNENSVVVQVSYGRFDALLVGDAGLPAESVLVRSARPAELLKVGHHGSAGATGEGWLAVLRPEAAVISVGPNRYGHPSPQVLGRLAAHGVAVFRTDRGGTVTIRSDGRYFEVVQNLSTSWPERIGCWVRTWLPSSALSSNRSACTPGRRASFPTFSTTSP